MAFLCDAKGYETSWLRLLGVETISAMPIPHMLIAQTLHDTKEVKAQLLDGEGVAVERIHFVNQLSFVVLKAIAFYQRDANKDEGTSPRFAVRQRLGGGSSRVRDAVQTGCPPCCAGERVRLLSTQLLRTLRHGGPFHERLCYLGPILQAQQRRRTPAVATASQCSGGYVCTAGPVGN